MKKAKNTDRISTSVEHISLPERLANPAKRALASAGIEYLEQLCSFRESEIRKLHGIGPNTLRLLRAALDETGLDYKQD